MKRLITITTLGLLITITLISQPGCSKETEESTSESNRWLQLLSILPANDNTIKASYLKDKAYLAEKVDQYPQVLADFETSYGVPFPVSIPRSHQGEYSDEEWKQTLGFIVTDVDQTVYARAEPHKYYEALCGRFSQEDIDNAVKTGPMNDMLETVSYRGHEFYSWGGDYELNIRRRSNVRPFGIGYRLALVEDFIFWVAWTDGMKEMIDSYENNTDSLADNEDYRLLAEALEGFDVFWAFFSAESQSQSHVKEVYKELLANPEDEEDQNYAEEIEREVHLKPYQAFATGVGIDDDGFYLVIALANQSKTVARQNATRLEQQINQSMEVSSLYHLSERIESMEIKSQGRLTLAKLYGTIWICWDKLEIFGDAGKHIPLLMHE